MYIEKNLAIKKVQHNLISLLSNLKFAILILLVIAIFSISGTIIEQNQSLEFYKENYPEIISTFGVNWKLIKAFNLDNVYRSWWYLGLLVLLGISLITCSLSQQLPMLKGSKYWKFLKKKQQLRSLELRVQLDPKDLSNFIHTLNKETYNIFQYKNFLFCYKGIVGRIAPIVVHISIIQIFIGAIIGATFGYSGQEFIPKAEIFHLQNVLNAGNFSQTLSKKALRVNNFWIDYKKDNTNNSINQFYTDISILNSDGEEVRRKVISVNNPLHFGDITLYQSDWDIIGLRGHIGDKEKTFQYQAKKIKVEGSNRWLSQIRFAGSSSMNQLNLLVKDLTKDLSVYDKSGEFIKKVREGESFTISTETVCIDEIITSTGIDIKSDPGIPFVYSGFLLLITSTLLSFISFSKIWIFRQGNQVYIGGTSNRAKVSFERYFIKQLSKI